MTCVEVRERLTEHALGVLPFDESRAVDRHLEWCAGCRKESNELRDGVANVGLALAPAEPAPGLEDRVVDRVADAAGIRPVGRRGRNVRRLTVVAVAAATMAMTAIGLAVAQRVNDRDTERTVAANVATNPAELASVIKSIGGRPFQAKLTAVPGKQGFGRAVVVASPGQDDFILVDVFPPTHQTAPYSVLLRTRTGDTIVAGTLKATRSGDLILWDFTGRNLSGVDFVSIVDRSGLRVMGGELTRYTGPSGS